MPLARQPPAAPSTEPGLAAALWGSGKYASGRSRVAQAASLSGPGGSASRHRRPPPAPRRLCGRSQGALETGALAVRGQGVGRSSTLASGRLPSSRRCHCEGRRASPLLPRSLGSGRAEGSLRLALRPPPTLTQVPAPLRGPRRKAPTGGGGTSKPGPEPPCPRPAAPDSVPLTPHPLSQGSLRLRAGERVQCGAPALRDTLKSQESPTRRPGSDPQAARSPAGSPDAGPDPRVFASRQGSPPPAARNGRPPKSAGRGWRELEPPPSPPAFAGSRRRADPPPVALRVPAAAPRPLEPVGSAAHSPRPAPRAPAPAAACSRGSRRRRLRPVTAGPAAPGPRGGRARRSAAGRGGAAASGNNAADRAAPRAGREGQHALSCSAASLAPPPPSGRRRCRQRARLHLLGALGCGEPPLASCSRRAKTVAGLRREIGEESDGACAAVKRSRVS
ncbi:translation initiation factor IF-2-like [Sciurus carolinensis]|uniref:translation initiation factor IF-2-like n=1 Tax=Sciurus carolinensis TaxID=30640 RepID=UPI001FB3594B|nr:translation initiation factor IF-2-like [Sciurus carolinensis]